MYAMPAELGQMQNMNARLLACVLRAAFALLLVASTSANALSLASNSTHAPPSQRVLGREGTQAVWRSVFARTGGHYFDSVMYMSPDDLRVSDCVRSWEGVEAAHGSA